MAENEAKSDFIEQEQGSESGRSDQESNENNEVETVVSATSNQIENTVERQEASVEINLEELNSNPAKMTFFLNQAYQAAGAGDMKQALAIFDQLIQVEMPPLDIQWLYVDFLHENRLYTEAETWYQSLIDEEPRDPELHSNYGFMLWEQGRIDAALKEFKYATWLDPEEEYYWYNRLSCAEQFLPFGEVEQIYEDALFFHPEHPEIRNNYAIFLHDSELYDEAATEFEEALLLNSENPRIFSNYAITLERLERFEEAEKNHLLAIEYGGGDMLHRNNYAQFLENQGRDDEAESVYKEIQAGDDVNTLFYLTNYTMFLVERDRAAEANQLYESYIEKHPNAPDAWNWYGEFLYDIGEVEASVVAAKKALELDPHHSVFKENVAHHLIDGLPERAEAELNQLHALYPEDQVFRIYTAWFYLRQGEAEKAENYLKELLQSDPKNPFILLHLANLYDGGEYFNFIEEIPSEEAKTNYEQDYYNPNLALKFYNRLIKTLQNAEKHYQTFDFLDIEQRIDELEQELKAKIVAEREAIKVAA